MKKLTQLLIAVVVTLSLLIIFREGYEVGPITEFRADGISSPRVTLGRELPSGKYEARLFSDKSQAEFKIDLIPGETGAFAGAPALDSGVLAIYSWGEDEVFPNTIEVSGIAKPDRDPVTGKMGVEYM